MFVDTSTKNTGFGIRIHLGLSMTYPPKILIVQSTPEDVQLVESVVASEWSTQLSQEGPQAATPTQIVCAPLLEEALDRLLLEKFNIVLLSRSLSNNAETEFAARTLKTVANAPVISLAALSSRESSYTASGLLHSMNAHSILANALATCTSTNRFSQYRGEEAMRQLKASEERYALAIEGVKDGIWDWDLDLNSVYYSEQWRSMLGLSARELSSSPHEWFSRVHPDDVHRLERSLEEHLAHRRATFRCEYRIRHARGHYIWVLSRGGALWNIRDEAYRIVGSQIDISYHKRLEQTLAKEKEMAQVVVKSMGDAVITTDAEGHITDFNPEAENLTGWSKRAAKHQPVSQVCRFVDSETHEPIESPSLQALRQGKIVSMNNRAALVSKQGEEIAVNDSTAPIRDKAGDLVGTVLVFRDVSAERGRAQQLAWQALHDPLTGLANRARFVEKLSQVSRKPNAEHVVCYLDLDHFKVVNDTCGHAAGDELLRQVATLLRTNIRRSDLLARLGGDEFGLIIYDCLPARAHEIACELCEAIQKFRFLWHSKVFSIGVSIGLVPIPREGAPTTRLMSLADAACYAAKNKGRNQVQVYSKENESVMQLSADFEWFSRITQAMENDSFCLYSQEIRPGDERKEVIHEVLLRLTDPITQNVMPPMAFIPPAERYDLMPKLDQWTIRQCFKQLEGVNTPGVLYSINLSGDTLNDDNFVAFLKQTLNEFHVDPHRICFEITETAAIANLTQVASTILSLKKLGFRFALDDFGSGMSSFVYLKQLPVDYLKIDGSLVAEINRDEVALATLKSINYIGHIMGLTTVAEYVSDADILRTVKSLNIDYWQGFAIAQPRPFQPTNRPPSTQPEEKISPEKTALNYLS